SWLWVRAERNATRAERLARTETNARGVAEARTAGLRRPDYVYRVNLAYREGLTGNPARALEPLEGCPEGLRRWEWYYAKRQCHLDLRAFREPSPFSVETVASSRDGRFVAYGSKGDPYALDFRREDQGDLVVREVATGREVFAKRGL